MIFTGKLSVINDINKGLTQKGDEWGSLTFEATESNPKNEKYPQIALFSYYKTGDYKNYVLDFNNNFNVGDEVTIDFSMKCQKYIKDGIEKKFYKNECFRIDKLENIEVISEEVPSVEQPNNISNYLPF